jgi:hypothetical protein
MICQCVDKGTSASILRPLPTLSFWSGGTGFFRADSGIFGGAGALVFAGTASAGGPDDSPLRQEESEWDAYCVERSRDCCVFT